MKYLSQPTDEAVEYVAKNMRPEDVEECLAFGHDPLNALGFSRAASTVCYTLVGRDNTPVAIVGVGEGIYKNWGSIWLLGTDGIKTNKMTFLRNSKEALQRLYDESGFDVFYNYTYAKNDLHHYWLRWLGFSFLRKVTLPPHNHEFYEFARLKG